MHTHTPRKAGLVGTLAAAAAVSLGGTSAEAQNGLPVVNVASANPKFGIEHKS